LTSTFTPIVFVVDDDISVRESLELLISCKGWTSESFSSAKSFLRRAPPSVPNCLILDIGLPDLDGLELQKLVSGDRREMPIIIITGRRDVPMTVQAMKAGAVEFLTKPFESEELLQSIRRALALSAQVMEANEKVQPLRDNYASLSRREREVMELVVSGLLNKQVAGELGISEITVKAHRGNLMRKMRADSLPDLVNMAATLGLSGPSTRGTLRRHPSAPALGDDGVHSR